MRIQKMKSVYGLRNNEMKWQKNDKQKKSPNENDRCVWGPRQTDMESKAKKMIRSKLVVNKEGNSYGSRAPGI